MIFFRRPADTTAFEEFFARQYVPASAKVPNVKRATVSRALGAPRGEPPYYLIQELYFDSLPDMNQALNSPDGRDAGTVLMSFAHELVNMMFVEVWESDAQR